jgi:hypothetical protein
MMWFTSLIDISINTSVVEMLLSLKETSFVNFFILTKTNLYRMKERFNLS